MRWTTVKMRWGQQKDDQDQDDEQVDLEQTISEPCRNGHDVTTSWCKQEPNEPEATTRYKQKQGATKMCKMEPKDGEPYWPSQLYVTKTPYILLVFKV